MSARQAFRQVGDVGVVSHASEPQRDALQVSVERAAAGLLALQHEAGYWCFELEADCTIPAEYILQAHFMDEIDPALEQRIAVYLREHQCEDGGWPLYSGGALDLSCTVKAYYALKLAGDDPEAPHMRRAREAILERGGAARANVFTRITLALFEQIPWTGVPFIPVEIMLLPAWFPFHIYKVSYWSRAVMVPLFVLCTLKPKARNPRGVSVRELFVTPPEAERDWFPARSPLNRVFMFLDKLGRALERFVPRGVRARAIARAERWVIERLNGVDGLGAIFPAMVNAHEMLALLGYPATHPLRRQTREAIDRLLVDDGTRAYCQPCVSPVWDTGLSALALQEAGADPRAVRRALDWLKPMQLLEQRGDWAVRRPHLRGGGWPFQFANDHFPDIDDTPVVAWAMLRSGRQEYAEAMARAAEWIAGMQSSNGGWASFDVDNTYLYLNEIPFADHGALLDPPTADVSARCVTFLAKYDRERFHATIEAGLGFLAREQEPEGCWFGRWGTNYIYGTWSVLFALEAAGVAPDDPMVRRAVRWLEACQREDGGWGESNDTYAGEVPKGTHSRSTAFQTAWALLALVAAGEAQSAAAERGAAYLMRRQGEDGLWCDEEFTAPGFPRVFYLKYHGYTRYFPLWALALYRNRRPDAH